MLPNGKLCRLVLKLVVDLLEYMAYPLEIESELIPKVIGYTENMSAFNKKFNVVSDCEMTPYPTGIVCENGKAVLTRQTEEE